MFTCMSFQMNEFAMIPNKYNHEQFWGKYQIVFSYWLCCRPSFHTRDDSTRYSSSSFFSFFGFSTSFFSSHTFLSLHFPRPWLSLILLSYSSYSLLFLSSLTSEKRAYSTHFTSSQCINELPVLIPSNLFVGLRHNSFLETDNILTL